MIPRSLLFAAAMAGFLVCSGAQAQVKNTTSPAPRPTVAPAAQHPARVSASSSHAGAKVAQRHEQAGEFQNAAAARVNEGFGPAVKSFDFDNTSGVPGLGFDFTHLAAISRTNGTNSSSHFVHHGHQGDGFFVAIPFGGYAYYAGDQGPDQAEQQSEPQTEQPAEQQSDQQAELQAQPQTEAIADQQRSGPSAEETQSGGGGGNYSGSADAAAAEAPVPDIGDFILVRRDGRILFASLFSVIGTQVRYITPEGTRRTLALADLDSDATQEMNEARGTTVQLHN